MSEYKPPGYQLWGQYAVLTLPDNMVSVITYPTLDEAKAGVKFLLEMQEELRKRAEREYTEVFVEEIKTELEHYRLYEDAWKGRQFKIVTRDISKWRTLDGKELDYEEETSRYNS